MAMSRRAMLGGAATILANPLYLRAADAADLKGFPSTAVRIVTTSQAGGGLDILTRTIADKLAGLWKQPVVVDNRPGANGMIATSAVAKSAPDGYTLLTTNSSIVQNVILYKKAAYRLEELAPVSQIVLFPIAFAVPGTSSANSVRDFVDRAKANPGKLTYGSYGLGSSGHLLGETLRRIAGIDIVHVPYKGEPPLLAEMLGGQLDACFASVGGVAPNAKAGKMRVLAVASPQRLERFAEFPTFADAGFPSVSVPGWGGLLAPAGTPLDLIQKVSADVARVVQMPDVASSISGSLGGVPVGNKPEDFQVIMARELSTWAQTIRESKIDLE